MTITDVEAIDAIANCANGEGFDKKTVKSLARYFMGMKFITATPKGIQDVVPYWVGFFADTAGVTPDRIRFLSNDSFGNGTNNRHRIESTFVVPVLLATGPPLPFTSLNLTNFAAGPKVVLTTQLKGCTFAIGNIGHHFHMGHAQPSGLSGSDLAQAVHQGPIFNGLPEALSTFLIHPGETINATSGLGYGVEANILGLVVKNGNSYSLSFIVAILDGNHPSRIMTLMMVKRKDSKWKTKLVKKSLFGIF